LSEIVSRLDLTYSFSSLNQLIHGLVGTKLKDNVDVNRIFKVFLVFDDELGLYGFMDLYLCRQLNKKMVTFSFAFDLVRVPFSIIFAANFLPVAVCVIS